MLHELPAGERAVHFTTRRCPCSPEHSTGERPGHKPGALLIHRAMRPATHDQAAGDER